MTARTVILWPDARLFKKTKPVDNFSEALSHAQDLYHTMVVSYGAGLASTQIGGDKSMCVIDSRYVPSLKPDDKLDDICVVLVNPTITPASHEIFQWEEQCLSIPDITASVKRHNNITLEYFDLSGAHHKTTLSEIEAATVQHEVDHLFGRLFIHRLTGYSRHRAIKKLQKREKLKRVQNSSEDVKIGRPKRNRKKKSKHYGKSKKR
tara:strand:- start:104 stop:724 length:621 start_codon:yes stop_codon:yes gene_type:complete